jgi:D-alanine-D-alanine ligase
MENSNKPNVAIVCGGYSSEREVSLKSGRNLYGWIDTQKFMPYIVILSKEKWAVEHQGQEYPICKEDFSADIGGQKINFDCAYITIHGTPGEDGRLQAYFEIIKLPYTSCGVFTSSLSFHKFATKAFLAQFGIKSAKSYLVRKNDYVRPEEVVKAVGLPCFIKPNNCGSSFGVSKIKTAGDIVAAIDNALAEDSEVIIEEFLEGREFTNGIFRSRNCIRILPITEIKPGNEFFDYEAKYTGKSAEITPAELTPELEQKCKLLTGKIYKLLNCDGVVRIDYILRGDEFYLLEVNTTPGLSPQSIVPQQIRAEGMTEAEVFTMLIEDALERHAK